MIFSLATIQSGQAMTGPPDICKVPAPPAPPIPTPFVNMALLQQAVSVATEVTIAAHRVCAPDRQHNESA